MSAHQTPCQNPTEPDRNRQNPTEPDRTRHRIDRSDAMLWASLSVGKWRQGQLGRFRSMVARRV
eukprot:1476000-Rhodomonas_salina.2